MKSFYGIKTARKEGDGWDDQVNFDLMAVAHRYEVISILEALNPEFTSFFTPESVCAYLRNAYVYKIVPLVKSCHTWIKQYVDPTGRSWGEKDRGVLGWKKMRQSVTFRSLDVDMVAGLYDLQCGISFKNFPEPDTTKVRIDGLPNGVGKEGLRGYFKAFGKIEEVDVVRPESIDDFGFVVYETSAEAQAALDAYPKHTFRNQRIYVTSATKNSVLKDHPDAKKDEEENPAKRQRIAA